MGTHGEAAERDVKNLNVGGSKPSSNTSECSEDKDGDKIPERRKALEHDGTDGGWGWMCVLACFLVHTVTGGVNRSYGIIYLYVLDRFQCSAAVAAWIGGCAWAVRFGCSPISTSLASKFSTRPVVFVGGLLCALGCILSAFAPSEGFLFFSYGVLGAFGGSLIYGPSIVEVGKWFTTKRGLAIGLGTAGSGFGAFACTPLVEKTFEFYGYFGGFLLLAGLPLHACISGALLRSSPRTTSNKRHSTLLDDKLEHSVQLNSDKINDGDNCTNTKESHSQPDIDTQYEQCNSVSNDFNSACPGVQTSTLSILKVDQDRPDVENKTDPKHDMCNKSKKSNDKSTSAPLLCASTSLQDQVIDVVPVTLNVTDSAINLRKTDIVDADESSPIRTGKDSEAADPKKQTKSAKSLFNGENSFFKKHLDLTLWKNPTFVMFALSSGLMVTSYMPGQMLLAALALERGVLPTEAAILLAAVGIADTLARIFNGFLFDRSCILPGQRIYYSLYMFASGMTHFGWLLCWNFPSLLVVSILHGLVNGGVVGLRALVISRLLGADNLSSSLGMLIFVQGAALLGGPPIAGLLRDVTHSYLASFLFTGTCGILAGSLLLLSYFYDKMRQGNDTTKHQ